jgi:hypothetical protein
MKGGRVTKTTPNILIKLFLILSTRNYSFKSNLAQNYDQTEYVEYIIVASANDNIRIP